MKQSKCLYMQHQDNSQKSRWMPWELGYFHGVKDKMVGILPLKKYGNNFNDNFIGKKYLGLYYYIDKGKNQLNEMRLWVRENQDKYVLLNSWLNRRKTICQNNKELDREKILVS